MSLAGHAQTAIYFSSLHLNPVLVQIGPFALRWYSLAYLAGILLGWLYLIRLLTEDGAPLTREQADGLVTWVTAGIIIGGRLAYVLFYDLSTYVAQPWKIFQLWAGGMSFHGGAFGVAIAIIIFARSHSMRWLRIIDYVAMCAPIGLLLGRLANFVNGELWGRPTTLPWGIVFSGGGPYPRHPSQLYEAALEGPCLFLLLWSLFRFTNARQRPGMLSGAFILGYGVFRFLVEYVREPDQQLIAFTSATGLHMGQWLCIPMIAGGMALMLWAIRRQPLPC